MSMNIAIYHRNILRHGKSLRYATTNIEANSTHSGWDFLSTPCRSVPVSIFTDIKITTQQSEKSTMAVAVLVSQARQFLCRQEDDEHLS